MQILKKSLALLLLFGIQFTNAQDQNTVQEAFNKSYVLESGKKYNEAIEALKSINAINNYPIQIRLGWLTYSAKRYNESVIAYKKAAELMPASIEALLGAVNPLVAQNKWEELEQIYLSILKNDPKNSTINFRLGQIYYNRKEYSKASLDSSNVLPDAVKQFEKWFHEAIESEATEANAMTSSFVSATILLSALLTLSPISNDAKGFVLISPFLTALFNMVLNVVCIWCMVDCANF